MKILKPDITVYWNQGVTLKVHSFLYTDPAHSFTARHRGENADLSIQVNISGIDKPEVTVTCNQGYNWNEGRSNQLLKLIPGAMEAVNAWVDQYDLIGTWRQELADYNSVMKLVDLPGVDIKEGKEILYYTLSIKPENLSGGLSADGEYSLPPLEVTVRVNKERATVQLQLDSGETDDNWDKIMCNIGYYSLDLPITMDSLLASISRPFQQYVNCLQGYTIC